MPKVLVVGGGTAGVAAATKASSLGSDVTILEESGMIGETKAEYLTILAGERSYEQLRSEAEKRQERLGVGVAVRTKVLSVDPGRRTVVTDGTRFAYRELVVATGGTATIERVEGSPKKGICVLRSGQDYAELSALLGNVSSAAVAGSSPLSLGVVERLVKRGIRVSLFAASPLAGYFSAPIQELVRKQLAASEVSVLQGRVERVAGIDRVEAVVSSGSVYPCEAVVVIPNTLPRIPDIAARRGGSGGLAVDRSMRTSEAGVFAAGDCAELAVGSSYRSVRQQSAARVMGEVAGANAAGGSLTARISGVLGLTVFGLELCSAGLTLDEARRSGFDAAEASDTDEEQGPYGHEASCSIVYDRTSGVVYGMQVAGWRALSYTDFASLAVATTARLSDLAYLESLCIPKISNGESPAGKTAKKALSQG